MRTDPRAHDLARNSSMTQFDFVRSVQHLGTHFLIVAAAFGRKAPIDPVRDRDRDRDYLHVSRDGAQPAFWYLHGR
jgi:hypothetical protein